MLTTPHSFRLREMTRPSMLQLQSHQNGADPSVFADLSEASVGLVTWSRSLPAEVEAGFATWARTSSAEFEEVVQVAEPEVSALLALVPESFRRWFARDLTVLIAQFSSVARVSALKVSFETIDSNRCRKFHQDNLSYRLICTYAGPGTEWVPAEFVDRNVLARPPFDFEEANRQMVRDQQAVRHASVGDVVLMKGLRHPHGTGVVHRSPPIEGSGTTRVALILSTTEDY